MYDLSCIFEIITNSTKKPNLIQAIFSIILISDIDEIHVYNPGV